MRQINNTFTEYELSDAELKLGSIFTDTNRAIIQNLIAKAASDKIALTYDVNSPMTFVQREAELQGQIGILTYLLNLSDLYTNQQ